MLNGYRIDNVNRPHRTGGGLAIIHRSSMEVKLLKNDIVHSIEYALWECKTSGTLIHVLAIYHPHTVIPTSVQMLCFLMISLNFWKKC